MEEYDEVTTVLESISDLSSDIEPIERLGEVCNNLQLNPSICKMCDYLIANLIVYPRQESSILSGNIYSLPQDMIFSVNLLFIKRWNPPLVLFSPR